LGKNINFATGIASKNIGHNIFILIMNLIPFELGLPFENKGTKEERYHSKL